MKILEAATIGCPIVSTSVGQKPDLRSFVVKNAQKMIKDKYSFASFSDNRLSIYREIMDKA